MSRNLASAAGGFAVIIAVVIAIHALDGGKYSTPINGLLLTTMNLLGMWFLADRIVWAAISRRARDADQRIVQLLAAASEGIVERLGPMIQEQVTAQLHAAIDAFGSEVFRAGMVRGAASDDRPHLVHSLHTRESGD